MTMRTVGLAEAKAQLSALLDAVESGDEVVITRRATAIARLVAEPKRTNNTPSNWPERLRKLHAEQSGQQLDAVALVRELREQV
jgi:prevent-host-death family protein